MIPTPTHPKNCTDRSYDQHFDELTFDSDVLCKCSNNTFEILYPGQTRNIHGVPFPVVAEIDSNFFFLLKAKAVGCPEEFLLLDQDYHGWNGFVCHDPNQALLPRPQLKAWNCVNCGNTKHKAHVRIHGEGDEDFINETEGEFDSDKWPDAFGWFRLDIKCTQCGRFTKEFVSLETM